MHLKELAKRTGIVWLTLLPVTAAMAHEEEDVRYLATGGADLGGCLTPATACRTLGYAAGQAGKGGEVKVAAGQYSIAGREDLFYLWSDATELTGGYRDDFHAREPELYPTLMIGVPPERRAMLEARGFQVVVDTKWSESEDGASVVQALEPMRNSSGPIDCVDGNAGGHPCHAIDQLSHLALGDLSTTPTGANDIWGFVDLNTEREYALLGLRNGIAVIDVSDPTAPFEVGTVSGQQTGWRDIKVLQSFDPVALRWQAHAYVTADATSDFLTIIDLTGLPHSVRLAARTTPDRSAHNLFLAGVDLSLNIPLPDRDPVIYLAGSNLDHGAFRAFELSDPLAPELVGRSLAGYMHDGTGAVLRDPAQIATCAGGAGSCEVLADFNEDRLQLWDITQAAAPQLLSSTFYGTSSYVHSGSWSEDGRYTFLHDEFDERDRALNTTLYVFDVSDLSQPELSGTWTGPSRATDHNGYPRGNRYYISNYSRGLTILDVTDPTQPVTAGYFDTFPISDNPVFSGAWGVYPFLPSRAILVSDIESGLFVLRDGTRTSDAGSIQFAHGTFGVRTGQTASVAVTRQAGIAGAVSVGWEVLPGSVGVSAEAALTGRLEWPAGDDTDREIPIEVAPAGPGGDVIGRLFIRLFDPRGGATLGGLATASMFVDEPGAVARLEFLDPPIAAANARRGFLVVERRGSTLGQAQVNYATRDGTAEEGNDYLPATGTLTWSDGDGTARVIEIEIVSGSSREKQKQFYMDFSDAAGADVPRVSATLSMAANATPPPPPPPPPPPAPPPAGNGGGGAAGALFLGMLVVTGLTRRRRSRYT